MSVSSLRLRLMIVGVVLVSLALIASSAGVVLLFERHVIRRALAELDTYANQLIAGIGRDANGVLTLERLPGDPRFERPLSGLYWQLVFENDGRVLRSRSLWEHELVLPPRSEKIHNNRVIPGPAKATLIYIDRRFTLPQRLDGAEIRIVTAHDHGEIREAAIDFFEDFLPAVLIIGLLLLGAAFAQVYVGLRPLGAVRERLAAVASGTSQRIGPGLPEEVRPLAMEIDSLLDDRDQQITKARERSADLAHALKTPLQVLTNDAERLQAKGETEIAASLTELATLMNRQVQRELARSRIGTPTAQACADVGEVAAQVIAVVRRTPAGSRLNWLVNIPTGMKARIDQNDLAEALGNLIENAAEHANSRIAVSGTRDQGNILTTITDDGSGIPESRLSEALSRGGRLDTKKPGAGLGLAIVSDIAVAWSLKFNIEDAKPGLRASLSIPGHSS